MKKKRRREKKEEGTLGDAPFRTRVRPHFETPLT